MRYKTDRDEFKIKNLNNSKLSVKRKQNEDILIILILLCRFTKRLTKYNETINIVAAKTWKEKLKGETFLWGK